MLHHSLHSGAYLQHHLHCLYIYRVGQTVIDLHRLQVFLKSASVYIYKHGRYIYISISIGIREDSAASSFRTLRKTCRVMVFRGCRGSNRAKLSLVPPLKKGHVISESSALTLPVSSSYILGVLEAPVASIYPPKPFTVDYIDRFISRFYAKRGGDIPKFPRPSFKEKRKRSKKEKSCREKKRVKGGRWMDEITENVREEE